MSSAHSPRAFAGTARFQPRCLLGSGGMGVVYRVFDVELGQDVALKLLHNLGPDHLYRLKAEFRSLAGLTHPNLVALYELVADTEEPFFTMEFVDGVPFTEWVRGGGALFDLGRLRGALRQLGVATAALHAAGKVHRDIKPSNVLVDKTGRVVLLDFGLARPWKRDDEGSFGGFAGTFAYAAPEQQWGKPAHPAADWYSVGVVLYEALAGQLPFGTGGAVSPTGTTRPPPRPAAVTPGVPAGLDALVVALLDPDPSRRPGQDAVLGVLDEVESARAARPAMRPVASELFVGRRAELAALRASLADVRSGHPVMLHVHGPSGIGKTELIAHFVRAVQATGDGLVLRGRCHPRESVSYKALDDIVDGLSRWLLGLPESECARFVPRHTGALLRLFPVLGRVPSLSVDADAAPAEPREVRQRGFGALRELLARVGDRRRLVLWIDDVQWSDLDSAALLRALLEPSDPPGALVILSYRSEERATVPLLRTLAQADELASVSSRTLAIEPLPAAEARELARRICPPHLCSDERIAAIAAESAGSPFFVGELARSVAAQVPTTVDDDAATPRLADILNARVRSLTQTAQSILTVVCAAGHVLQRTVALNAAGVGEAGRPAVFALEEQRFVRATTLNDESALEVYHDRIRDAVVPELPAGGLSQLHRRIADALRAVPDPDPRLLFEHFLAGGEDALAGEYALQAADLAARGLAFERAATLYREALRLKPGAASSPPLLANLAEALSNCGRGREAGEAFEAAADALGPTSSLDERALAHRGRAAEQYLRSGHLARGTDVTRAVLAAVGIRLPRSTRRALVEALHQRARLGWRGLGFELRDEHALSPRMLLRLDACWGATISFSMINPTLGEALAVRHLIEALDLGERSRIIHALGYEAARGATIGGRFFRRRSQRILDVVQDLERETREPYDRAWVRLSIGTTAYADGQWLAARDECEAAATIWRQECTGVRWETFIGDVFALTARAHRGEIRALATGLPPELADARARGDRYAAVALMVGMLNLLPLAQGHPEHARALLDEARAALPSDIFHVQHYLHALASVHIDLYVGDATTAWGRIVATWPKVKRAHLLRMEMFRVEGYHLRARAALGAAADAFRGSRSRRWTGSRLLRLATADARRIARSDMPSAAPFAATIRGGVEHLCGRREEALAEYERAAAGFDRAGMALYRAAAEMRAGTLAGGETGRARAAAAEAAMRAEDIIDPGAIVAVLAPC